MRKTTKTNLLMNEIKEKLNKWRAMPCLWIGRFNIVQMTVLSNHIYVYIFNAISFIIPARFCFQSPLTDMFINFRERGREKEEEREREKHQCERNIDQLPPVCDPSGDCTHNCMCPDWESNPQPFGIWDDAPTNWHLARTQQVILRISIKWC